VSNSRSTAGAALKLSARISAGVQRSGELWFCGVVVDEIVHTREYSLDYTSDYMSAH